MEIYADLFESMVDYCGWLGFRNGPVYTLAMIALGTGLCLNFLSVLDLLCSLGVVGNPYRSHGALRPQHYVYALLYGAFLANVILARVKFGIDRECLRSRPDVQTPGNSMPRFAWSRIAAPAYIIASTGLFVVTQTLVLLSPT